MRNMKSPVKWTERVLTEIISGKGTAFGEKKKELMKAPKFDFGNQFLNKSTILHHKPWFHHIHNRIFHAFPS
jgi:hypothetical protein